MYIGEHLEFEGGSRKKVSRINKKGGKNKWET